MASETIGIRRVQGASAQSWKKRISASVATAALTAPACVAAKAADNVGIFEVDNFPAVRLIFGGSDAENETINYQVILWSKGDAGATTEGWIPTVIASGVATLGALTYAVAGLGTSTYLVADTITNTARIGGVEAFSPANDRIASLVIPTRNATFIEVQTDLGTAATADVFAQQGELQVQPTVRARSLINGSKAVATPSTAVPLVASSTMASYLIFTAKRAASDNTGNIFFGGSGLDQGVAEGVEMYPGDVYEWPLRPGEVVDLTDIYIDADTASDGVVFTYSPA